MASSGHGSEHTQTAATPSSGPGVAPKSSRRPHRKSRDGCAECKRRHIRCDKGRPACTNCTIAERACAYPPSSSSASSASSSAATAAAKKAAANRSPPVSSPKGNNAGSRSASSTTRPPLLVTPKIEEPITPAASASPSEPRASFPRLPFHLGAFSESTTTTTLSPGGGPSSSATTPLPHHHHDPPPSQLQPPSRPSTYSAKDLVLLHHASTSMPDAILGRGQTTYIMDIALRYAVESPYLINQLLAFAALNLAHVQHDPSAAEPLRHQATELQTRALADFTKETEYLTAVSQQTEHQSDQQQQQQQQQDDAYHGVPRFLFASILGLHVFADTLLNHHPDLPTFLHRFTGCMHLHRGVRTVLKPTWEGLLQTELGPLFSALSHATATRQKGDECDRLIDFIRHPRSTASEVDDGVKETCLEAIEHLQWGFDLQARLSDAEGPHAPSATSVLLPGPFVDLLRQMQPLALVSLAYFAVIVHRSRRCWIFGDSGAFVIRAVASHLGSAWEEPLAWPLEQLEGT
ncbi:hypothetical protein NLU13_3402 [Sarocladium strictum]|uniref:Zn(2)-C6 fungal-type domain-containing protein n=1 Tax=Sarocladium strictum TaxID=5046 RepID=A0AA39GNS2_SARSR|nr:hypothetical protein NLU13_3402 [Sarocladium strictum]